MKIMISKWQLFIQENVIHSRIFEKRCAKSFHHWGFAQGSKATKPAAFLFPCFHPFFAVEINLPLSGAWESVPLPDLFLVFY